MLRLIRVARALRAVIVPAVVAALIAFPLGVLASHSFSDVPTNHPFHADIAALKDSGVSPTGCGGGKFCPDDYVTRGQMAAFLNRLGALGPGKVPVANADKLDGLDSAAFVRGTKGTVLANRIVLPNGDSDVILLGLPGLGRLEGTCATGGTFAEIRWRNTESAAVDMWENTGGQLYGRIVPPTAWYEVAFWTVSGVQTGDTLMLGRGNDPGARQTASVSLAAFRSAAGDSCGLQATATGWSTP